MESVVKELLIALGEDPEREGLKETPRRVTESLQYLTQGYQMSVEEVVGNALFDSDSSDMILVKDIEIFSLCEHHLLPFTGTCTVAYLPQGKILGLSKIARVIELYARRLQLQERLTAQIAEGIREVTGAAGVGVVMQAKHMCMCMRGVEKQQASMKTSSMLGAFRESSSVRHEFFELLKN